MGNPFYRDRLKPRIQYGAGSVLPDKERITTMNAMRFTSAAIVSLASLLLISDTGYSEEIVRQKRALFTPISADFGDDHFHMTLLSYERNLVDSESGSYLNWNVSLYERFNLVRKNQAFIDRNDPWLKGTTFEALAVPGIEIGRKFENGFIKRAGFYGTVSGIMFEGSSFINTGFMVQVGFAQVKAGVFRGVVHYGKSHLDDQTDLSPAIPYDELTAVSYVSVGLSPTFSF